MDNRGNILIVLVTYKVKLEDSSSFQTLKKHLHHLTCPYKIVVYNNSPEIDMDASKFENVHIFTSGQNDKLSIAYNYALGIAEREKYEWMMLLDQDSEITEEYILQVSQTIAQNNESVKAYAPSMYYKGRFISASAYNKWAGPFWGVKPATATMAEGKYITAVNSCSVIRTEALLSVGGFSNDFPLDYLDCWYYYQFYKKGYEVRLLPTKVEHHLSIFSLIDMGLDRYKDYMEACARFAHQTEPSILFFFRLRTLLRCVKFSLLPSRWKFLSPTFLALFK